MASRTSVGRPPMGQGPWRDLSCPFVPSKLHNPSSVTNLHVHSMSPHRPVLPYHAVLSKEWEVVGNVSAGYNLF